MFATALFVGGKAIQQRRNNRSNRQQQNDKETAEIETKLNNTICGRKMDSNPNQLRLSKALEQEKQFKDNSSSAAGDEHYQAFMDIKTRAKDLSDIIALSSPASSHYWREQLHNEARQIRISTRTFLTFPVDMVKAEFYVPCSPRDFLTLLEFEHRGTWDENFKGGDLLFQQGTHNEDDFCIKTMKFDAFPNLVRPRDFEMAVYTKLDPANNSAFVKAISTLYEFGGPSKENSFEYPAVRGYIPLSGFVVHPVAVNENVCHGIYEDIKSSSSSSDNSTTASTFSSLLAESNSNRSDTSSSSSKTSSFTKSFSALVGKTSKSMCGSNNNNNNNNNSANGNNSKQNRKPLFPNTNTTTVIHSKVTYVALVHPRGSIPVLLLNLIIGKQTTSMKNLQTAALKLSLKKKQSKL